MGMHRSEGATALLGIDSFVAGAHVDVDGEWWLAGETTVSVGRLRRLRDTGGWPRTAGGPGPGSAHRRSSGGAGVAQAAVALSRPRLRDEDVDGGDRRHSPRAVTAIGTDMPPTWPRPSPSRTSHPPHERCTPTPALRTTSAATTPTVVRPGRSLYALGAYLAAHLAAVAVPSRSWRLLVRWKMPRQTLAPRSVSLEPSLCHQSTVRVVNPRLLSVGNEQNPLAGRQTTRRDRLRPPAGRPASTRRCTRRRRRIPGNSRWHHP